MPDEIHQRLIRQDAPGLRKRWFQGEQVDLSIWQDSTTRVVHFQLLLDPDLVIDYRSGRGMLTGHMDQSRSAGHFPASAVIRADSRLDVRTLEYAFRQFTEYPPVSQKRVLKFVAETLSAAIGNPDAPAWPDAELPAGQDSCLMDKVKLEDGMKKFQEHQQRQNIIARLLARFVGGKGGEG